MQRIQLIGDQCVYCGESRQCTDHFPPRSLRVLGFILPSCLECNGLAGARHPFDFAARARLVNDRLNEIYAGCLAEDAAQWCGEDLTEVDYVLVTEAHRWENLKKTARRRVAWSAMAYIRSIDRNNYFAVYNAGINFTPENDKRTSGKPDF
jgi:hypothetical protein